jgi:hypothetical protein
MFGCYRVRWSFNGKTLMDIDNTVYKNDDLDSVIMGFESCIVDYIDLALAGKCDKDVPVGISRDGYRGYTNIKRLRK